jgi:hypothetical protein
MTLIPTWLDISFSQLDRIVVVEVGPNSDAITRRLGHPFFVQIAPIRHGRRAGGFVGSVSNYSY